MKSVGNYLQFVTSGGSVTTHGSLQELVNVLNHDDRFMQIHRSYVVNVAMIDHISTNDITVDNQVIPIGNKFQEGFKAAFIQRYLLKL